MPASYSRPVKGVPLPGPSAGALAQALDGQTAKLDQVNEREADTLAIVGDCDKHNAIVTAPAPKPKVLGLF